MNNKNRYLHEAGSIAVLLIAVASILFFTVFGVKKRWQNGLRDTVQNVLDTQYPDTYKVESFCQINSPFAVSGAVYALTNLTEEHTAPDSALKADASGKAKESIAVHTTGKEVRDVVGEAAIETDKSVKDAADDAKAKSGSKQKSARAKTAKKAAGTEKTATATNTTKDASNDAPIYGSYAVIIRAGAVSGSLPLVYVFENDTAFFAGIGGETEKLHFPDSKTEHLEYALLLSKYGLTEKIVSFWQNRARLLIPTHEEAQS